MEIGKTIQQLRVEQGYTLKEFGGKIGMSASFLSDIEHGKSRPSLKRCKEIATGLHVPVSFLLGESEDMQTVADIDQGSTLALHGQEGEAVVKALADFDRWTDADKKELAAYLRAKKAIRGEARK